MQRSTIVRLTVLPLLCLSAYSFNAFAEEASIDGNSASSDCADTDSDSGKTVSQAGDSSADVSAKQPAAVKSASPE